MTNRLFALAILVALAAAPPAVAGEEAFQGTLDSPAGKLRLVLKMTKAADGSYSGTIDSVDQAATGLKLDSISVKDGAVEFELKRLRAGFKGKLGADGSEISGEFTQGSAAMPLNLRRFDPSMAPTPPKGEPLNAEERHFGISHLERTRDLFLKSLEGLSEAQWRFKAAPERWSIAEVAEHLVLSEEFLLKRSSELFMKIPPAPDRAPFSPAALRQKDETVLKVVVDRSRPAQAPEPLKPTNNYPTPDAAKAEFSKRRARSIEYVRTTPDDLRNHAVVSGGPLGNMDAFQQLMLMAAHTERHTLQINEVKAAAAYPK